MTALQQAHLQMLLTDAGSTGLFFVILKTRHSVPAIVGFVIMGLNAICDAFLLALT